MQDHRSGQGTAPMSDPIHRQAAPMSANQSAPYRPPSGPRPVTGESAGRPVTMHPTPTSSRAPSMAPAPHQGIPAGSSQPFASSASTTASGGDGQATSQTIPFATPLPHPPAAANHHLRPPGVSSPGAAPGTTGPATAIYGINQHAPTINLNTPSKPTLTALPRDETLSDNPVAAVFQQRHVYTRRFDAYVDSLVPYVTERYIALGVLILLFLTRILFAQGYYIVCYAHAIYLLNIFLAFLTPKFDPSSEEHSSGLDNEGGIHGLDAETKTGLSSFLPGNKRSSVESSGLLGNRNSDEFKPFIRRLPEFQFWYASMRATIYAVTASFIPLFDIPVFWPILLMYFCVLFFITMRRQIKHMIKYKYMPFDIGKKKFSTSSLGRSK